MRIVKGQIVVGVLAAGATALMLSAPARAAELDCTIGCLNVSFAGALWTTVDQAPTGTGNIDSFVRISTNNPIEDGVNTSARPLLNDENSSPQFTRDLPRASVPIVNIGGVNYYEFLLDINQQSANPLLSLSGIKICTETSGGLNAVDTCPGTVEYDLGNNTVKLDYNLNSGSGSGDLFMYIPTATLGNQAFLYLWSQFGGGANPFPNNDGFEEWAVRTPTTGTPAPEPATLLLLGAGLIAGARRLRKTRTV